MVQKLTFQEREKLFEYLNKNYSNNLIAQLLNRHISTIYRERNRLSSAPYSPIAAQSDASLKVKNSKKNISGQFCLFFRIKQKSVFFVFFINFSGIADSLFRKKYGGKF